MRTQARKGRDGSISIVVNEDPLGGTEYAAMTIDRAVVIMGGAKLDSAVDTDDMQIIGNVITYKKGAFDVDDGIYPVEIVVFNDTYTNGKTIVGAGYDSNITTNFLDVPIT